MPTRPTSGNIGSERAYIMKGDTTTHGGLVMEGNPRETWHGLEAATKGHKVFCPKCRPHVFIIAEGMATNTSSNGMPRALEGHQASCGAELVARPASHDAVQRADAMMNLGLHEFDEQIQAHDQKGNSLARLPYFIERADGATFFGETDEQGNCPRIASQSRQELKVWFGLAAEDKITKA